MIDGCPRPVPSVAVILNDEAGRVLWGRRKATAEFGGCWEIAGGKMEWGEQPQDAARREIEEEIGVRLGYLTLIDVIGHETPSGAWYSCAIFAASCPQVPPPCRRETQDLAWLGRDELPDPVTPFSELVWNRWIAASKAAA